MKAIVGAEVQDPVDIRQVLRIGAHGIGPDVFDEEGAGLCPVAAPELASRFLRPPTEVHAATEWNETRVPTSELDLTVKLQRTPAGRSRSKS